MIVIGVDLKMHSNLKVKDPPIVALMGTCIMFEVMGIVSTNVNDWGKHTWCLTSSL
jgi:hypothetical protein